MKIGIVGHGYVGSAVSNAHLYFGKPELLICDPALGKKSASMDQIKTADLIYVCVPSPSNADGSCDTSILEGVIAQLAGVTVPVVSKTTAPPAVYEKLLAQCPTLLHCPEFLTAANHKKDYLECKFFVLGGDAKVAETALPLMFAGRSWGYFDLLVTDIKSAALFKYMMNSYLATKVTFMNEFYQLAQSLGVDWEEMKVMMRFDSRIGNTHISVPGPDGNFGWGGACFPKDLNALVKYAAQAGVELSLIPSVINTNTSHRNTI